MSTHLNWDWELEIRYGPGELGAGEPYELYFFLGPVPSSPAEWRGSPSLFFEPVASHGNTTVVEFRDIKGYLERRSQCENDDAVIPYLRKQLSWRVKKRYSDEEIEKSKLKSLKISVYGPDSDRDGPIPLSGEVLDSYRTAGTYVTAQTDFTPILS